MPGFGFGFRIRSRRAGSGGGGGGAPAPPAGFVYLADDDGARLTGDDGAYLMEAE